MSAHPHEWHARPLAALGLLRMLPASGVHISTTGHGFQAWETELRQGCREIVAARFRKIKKLGSHHDADRVTANVPCPSVAAAVPINPVIGLIEQS